jgi:pyoverdine/dityrosine biosynthesis protein Dit1
MQQLSNVLQVFEKFRMPPSKINEWETGGRDLFSTQLEPFITANKQIEFLMLGYPFKSTNHVHKTLGVLPDLAEEVSMKNFEDFGKQISEVYTPGVKITLLSDGFVFNDILEERDSVVDEYAEVAREMARAAPVQLLSLKDVYGGLDLSTARSKLLDHFGVSEIELESRILTDPNTTMLYRGMIRFMEEELAFKTFPSKRQHHLAAKSLARVMMFRNEAYSQLANSEFSSNIRLSMHPTTNKGKYSFQLIPSPEAWTSPWHCALLTKCNGVVATIHKKDAELAGYELVKINGRDYAYTEKCPV